jgi:hypothetical protein
MTKHLWITSKLLSMKVPVTDNKTEPGYDYADLMQRLQRHVIATCYPKIVHRLQLPASKFFIDSLKSVKGWKFDEDQRGTPSAKEIANDAGFAAHFLLLSEENQFAVNFPNLLEQAKLIENKRDNRLYTKETCLEFHIMLVSRIDDFNQSLLLVNSFKRPAKPPTEAPPDLQEGVLKAAKSGSMLQQLIKGAALQMHLKTIAPLLKGYDPKSLSTPFGPYAKPNEQERDVEFEVVCESADYLDWLKLLVTHFDAISILVNYVTGPEFKHDGISIEIVLPPPSVVRDILPWQSLLSDPKLFPQTTQDAHSPDNIKIVTNAEITKFLTESLAVFPQFKLAKKEWKNGQKPATIKCLKKLKEAKIESWVKWAETMMTKVESDDSEFFWDNTLDSDDSENMWASGIDREIKNACESTAFFAALEENEKFGGTIHCEACLASLLTESSRASEDILARMKVTQLSNLFLSPVSHFL